MEINSLDGKSKIRFADYKGKNILLVNVASECGYTPQYEGLQQIADQYKDNLVIIGFPCNQFGGQEPGTSDEIAGFCKKNYGVTFPLTEKIEVKGKHQHPIYQWLTHKDLNGLGDFDVKWNFNKFLVDKEGKLVAYYPSSVKLTDEQILARIK